MKRNRILVSSVLFVASLAFLGLMFLPVVGALQGGSRVSSASPSPVASPAGQEEEMAAQARGYELVLEREPDNQTALRGLLEIRIRQGNVEGAIAPLTRLSELNPEQTDFQVLLAQAQQQLGDPEAAARVYRDILSRQPGEMNALQGLVGLMMSEERPEAAIALLQDTLRIADEQNQAQPGSVNQTSVQLLLGQVYAEELRFDEAIAIYDQAIATAGQDFRPILGKAIVLQAAGRDNEASPLFEMASALAPAQYQDQISQLASRENTDAETTSPLEAPEANPSTLPAPTEEGEASSPSRVTGNSSSDE